LTADPEFVGVFPVMYSLDVEENHLVEQFYKGWVMDELVGMLILNARGLARIVKVDAYTAIDTFAEYPSQATKIAERGLYA